MKGKHMTLREELERRAKDFTEWSNTASTEKTMSQQDLFRIVAQQLKLTMNAVKSDD